MSEKSSLPDPDEDATKPFTRPNAGGESLDATAPYEPVDADDDPDATRPIARPDTTAGAGAAGAGGAGATDPDATQVSDAWTGRAEVRGPIPPEEPDEYADQEPEEPGRRWWLPILLGVLGLLVVIAGITAAMMLSGNDDEPTPTPSVSGSIATSPSAASPSAAPSSAAPSSAPPSAETTVLVPETFGNSQGVATNKLEALGLKVNVVFQEDPIADPGTVLATTPPAGSVVPAGSEITIIVAKALPSSSPSPSHQVPEESLSPQGVPSGN
jgi:hypothetical protein